MASKKFSLPSDYEKKKIQFCGSEPQWCNSPMGAVECPPIVQHTSAFPPQQGRVIVMNSDDRELTFLSVLLFLT